MEEIKPTQKKTFTPSTSYDLEFSGRAIKSIGLRGAWTVAGAAATIRDDAAFRMLSTPEVNQAENPLIRMRGASWRHLSAVLNGRYDEHVATATLAKTHCMLHLERLLPGALINAADKKVFIRGDFAALANYAGTAPTSLTGDLKPYVITSQRDPTKGFMRPRITEKIIPIVAANDDQQDVIRFEQDLLVVGLLLTTDDSPAGNSRTDGLIKNIRIEHTGRDGGTTEVYRSSWGQARALLQAIADFNPEDYARSVGVVLLPFKDRSNPQWNGAQLFRAGSSLTLHFDSNAAVEADFTAATIAAGSQVVVTVLGFTPVAGSGDSAAQLTEVKPAASVAAAVPMNSRAKRRLARAGTS